MKATPEDLRHAYRLLLGREPDSAGLASHQGLMRERHVSVDELAQLFLGSEEFQSRWLGRKVALADYCLFVSPGDREIGAKIASGHAYEPYVESVIRRVLKPGDTFLDVGANIGYFTALAAFLVGPEGRVIAFEPLDANVQLIHAMIWENRFRNITVFPFAASSEARLVAMGSQIFSSNAGIVDRAVGQQRPRTLAQSQRIDDLLATTERIDVAKFDIEGHEIHAWRGAANLLAKHRPHVLTEFHPKCIRDNTGLDPAQYLSMLLDYSGAVEVLHRTRPAVECRDAESVLREWQSADDEFHMDGGMHIDLYARAPGR
jgi:FkbM family methyltransferase